MRMTDVELLEKHRGGCEEAFADIVRAHAGWVYALARRRLRDAHLAEDVVQAVFIVLDRKLPKFAADGAFINWLHKTAWYATETAARNQRRREIRESEAATMRTESDTSNDRWDELAPMLDELIGKLSRSDREAILLRYFRSMSFAEVGEQLGSSEDAARKRVERAVAKLRQMAERRGMNISAAVLATDLAKRVLIPPPAGLVARATAAATTSAAPMIAASSTSIVKGAIIMMAKAQASMIGTWVLVGMICVGGSIWVTRTATAQPALSNNAPANNAPTAVVVAANLPAIPKADLQSAPYSEIVWPFQPPQVKVGSTRYELLAIDDLKVEQIAEFARKTYGNLWQKRFDEDLVEVLTQMGDPLGEQVILQLRTLDTNKIVTLEGVPMTKSNRRSIYQADNPQLGK